MALTFASAIRLAHKIVKMPLVCVPTRVLVRVADRQCPKLPALPQKATLAQRLELIEWGNRMRQRAIIRAVGSVIMARGY